MPAPRPYLLVHIPKTAGTSLRRAMSNAYGSRVLFDYGKTSEHTSPAVLEHVYRRRDFEALNRIFETQDTLFLAGHVSYPFYRELFPPERVITFIREPVARVVSEWNHARRNYGYPGDLKTFASDGINIDRQSKVLSGIELERIGFIGLSERYRDCLAVLNARFGYRLQYLESNKSPGRSALSGSYAVADADREVIVANNAEDLKLYERVKRAWDAALANVP